MRFGIYSNGNRDINYEFAAITAKIILKKGAVPVFDYSMKCDFLNEISGVSYSDFKDCDLIISIGGDGTLLYVVSKYRDLNKPFVGVNKGSIGFLSEISPEDIEDAIDRLVNGNYSVLNRTQLEAEVFDCNGLSKGTAVCLNDIVVSRGTKLHIVKMDLLIDNQYVEKFYGDGIIISTPTGSTAYSLAAGGPILMPELKNMIITPLCSHTLQSSSYVIGPGSYVELKLGNFESAPLISPDGHDFVILEPNDTVKISLYGTPLKTAMLGYSGFFQTVRKKIIARGSFYENSKE